MFPCEMALDSHQESCAPVERFAHFAVSVSTVLGFVHRILASIFFQYTRGSRIILYIFCSTAARTLGTKSKIHHSPLGTLEYIGTIGAGKFFARRDFAQLLPAEGQIAPPRGWSGPCGRRKYRLVLARWTIHGIAIIVAPVAPTPSTLIFT